MRKGITNNLPGDKQTTLTTATNQQPDKATLALTKHNKKHRGGKKRK